MKTMIYMYLDNELSTWAILDFFRNNIWGKSISYKKYNVEIQKAVRNYKNPKGRKFQKKIILVNGLLKTDGKWAAVIPRIINYLL